MYDQYKAGTEVIERYLRAMEWMEASKRYAGANPERYAELVGLDPEDQFKGRPTRRAKQINEELRGMRRPKLRHNRKASKPCKWWRKEGGAIKRFLTRVYKAEQKSGIHMTEDAKYFMFVTGLQYRQERGDKTAGILLAKMGEVTSVCQ
ncbi:MAG TPA: hypothetical protein VJA25_11980 [Dehalococcoidia bacterium]|nr:hypothetical protein [Dehalococcoidia bacterium]